MWVIVSYIAAFLTTISFLPQAIKTIKTKDTKDLSLITYIMFVIGTSIWTLYGFLDNEYAVFFANIVTTFFASIILFYKAKDVINERRNNKK
ncbi:MAG: SemiSWEET transporter [Candidatus Izemoplasmatales bacterium]|jgi:MtN3 and saliva related transmembrane protein|nr:SemiSWEET transporter [Candidatus Izemoplasmatales bacterium]